MLLEEMRGKVLAMRGLQAGPDELLMALSSRHALQLVGDLLVRRGTQVVLQQPTEPEFERRVRAYGAEVSVLDPDLRSEEHTSELQSLMRISYAVFCLKKKK